MSNRKSPEPVLIEQGQSQDPRVSNHGDGWSKGQLSWELRVGDLLGQNLFSSGEGEWQQWNSKSQLSQRLYHVPNRIPSTWHGSTHLVQILIPLSLPLAVGDILHGSCSWECIRDGSGALLCKFHFESGEIHWHSIISSSRPKSSFLIVFFFLPCGCITKVAEIMTAFSFVSPLKSVFVVALWFRLMHDFIPTKDGF